MKKTILLCFAIIAFALNVKSQIIPGTAIGNLGKGGKATLTISENEAKVYLKTIYLTSFQTAATIESISLVKHKKNYWVLEGKGKYLGSSAIIRVQLKNNNKTLEALDPSQPTGEFPFAEACTGAPCPSCEFDKKGGCKCSNDIATNICNHNITKTN